MTNIKITQEAKQAAECLKTYLSIRGLKDGQIERSMQALINQTVERCAKVAEEYKQMGYMSERERDYCQQHGEDVAEAIRTLKDN